MYFSAGGLVTAVAPVVVSTDGIWVGWPGIHLENPNEQIPESDPKDRTPTAGLKSEKVRKYIKLKIEYILQIKHIIFHLLIIT